MVAMFAMGVAAPRSEALGDPSIYREALGTTWQNWSWGTDVELASTNPTRSGNALAATLSSAWAGLSLRSTEAVPFASTDTLQFWLHGGSTGTTLRVATSLDDANSQLGTLVTVSSAANTWSFISITSAQLGNPAQIKRLNFLSVAGETVPRFSLDDITISAGITPTTITPTTITPTTITPTTITPTTTPLPSDGTIRFDATAPGRPFTSLNYGTNSSFYVGSWAFANSQLRTRTALTTGFIRFPGSQDSQRWGWASCEVGFQFGASVPCGPYGGLVKSSEFIGLLRATGSAGVVTLNVNATAGENAAFVAFMNGSVNDARSLGVDQKGTNWQTVGYWARARAAAGYPDPVGIKHWEFGNETFGGKVGPANCLSWGWEETWTCDPASYINGIGTGPTRRDGYIATRNALRTVDASILIGAPAVEVSGDYNNWSSGLIGAGGSIIDFLVVHPYFVWVPPANDAAGNATILAYPETHWAAVRNGFLGLEAQYGITRRIPILASEYNLTPGPQNDPAKRIQGQGNAMILADSVGQMAQIDGYLGSNVFNLFGAAEPDGTWFGQIRNDGNFTRTPSYYAFALWERFGSSLLPVSSSFNPSNDLSVYAGRIDGSTVSLYVINKTGSNRTAAVQVDGVTGLQSEQADTSVGSWLFDERPAFNGTADQNDDLSNAPGAVRPLNRERSFSRSFAPYSITLLRLRTGGTPPTSTTIATQTTTTTTTPVPTTTVTTTTVVPTTTTTTVVPTTTTGGARNCRVTYRTFWDSGVGYGADVQIANLGPPISTWTLNWNFTSQESVSSAWGANVSIAGGAATATPQPWTAAIATNASVGFGLSSSYVGPLKLPAAFTLNGQPCQVG